MSQPHTPGTHLVQLQPLLYYTRYARKAWNFSQSQNQKSLFCAPPQTNEFLLTKCHDYWSWDLVNFRTTLFNLYKDIIMANVQTLMGSRPYLTFILREWICMMRARASSLGIGNSILRSRRPERRSAGSRMSTLFVAAMTWKQRTNWKPGCWGTQTDNGHCCQICLT